MRCLLENKMIPRSHRGKFGGGVSGGTIDETRPGATRRTLLIAFAAVHCQRPTERMPVTPALAISDSATAVRLQDDLREALDRGRLGLLNRQHPDGHWVGELEGDTILESEYVLLLAFLGHAIDPRLGHYLRDKALPDGGWPNYPGGPADLSVSVKGYFALKILGDSVDAPHMQAGAEVIRKLGGAANSNSFTRFYLALLGQIPYANCPTVQVEMMLLPRWFTFNIYAMSAWSRTIVVPLAW